MKTAKAPGISGDGIVVYSAPHMDQSTLPAKKVNIRPGPSVLSVLRYLNYSPWFALAEFVDNSLQSYAELRDELLSLPDFEKLRVTIEIDATSPARIVIRDNAAGIALAAFPRAFRPAMVPPDRSGLSEFGMGMKSAACWFAPRWHVRTKALGETVERIVRFDIARIVEDELEEVAVEERPAKPEDHYTEIVLEEPYNVPVGRTLGKIKEHLADIYRVFLRDKTLELKCAGEPIQYVEPTILNAAPQYKDGDSVERIWRKEINFDFGDGLRVKGFAALRDPGNYAKSGFALFRRGRLIQGSGEDGYRPAMLFGTAGSSSYARLRLFGELHLEGFEVSHTKDGFRWDENEQPFLALVKEHLDDGNLPLLKQCEHYRSLLPRKDRTRAAEQALTSTGDALAEAAETVLPRVADQLPVESPSEPLAEAPALARRDLDFNFRGRPWHVEIELSDDPGEGEWLSISDTGTQHGPSDTLQIRVSMAHPFMVSFAQTDPENIDALLRVAAAIALSEKLARLAGVKAAGTIRRNVNEILREALSRL